MTVRMLVGDCRDVLRTLEDRSVQACVTSPPYWGLRDYGATAQVGIEKSVEEYVDSLVDVFAGVWRVLRDDGTLWLNLGDSYADSGRGSDVGSTLLGTRNNQRESRRVRVREIAGRGIRPKNLIGLPWRVAFALQAAGWYLRSDIIWAKPNGMPESVKDRPTRSHEYVFLLSKSRRYYYDAAAVRTPLAPSSISRLGQNVALQNGSVRGNGLSRADRPMKAVKFGGEKGGGGGVAPEGARRAEKNGGAFDVGANLRDVWWISTEPTREQHFAMMPTGLAKICVSAGAPSGGVVLDPFAGAGTTGLVADRLGRNAILIELNPAYARMADERIRAEAPLLFEATE